MTRDSEKYIKLFFNPLHEHCSEFPKHQMHELYLDIFHNVKSYVRYYIFQSELDAINKKKK